MNITLRGFRDTEFDLDALARTAQRLLRGAQLRVDDGRVAGAVDPRGIRYYQTLGIVERPLRYDGRRAVYGYRHLLQVLAVRTLQAEGYPLALIQTAVPPRSTAELEDAVARALGAETEQTHDTVPELPAAAAAAPVAAAAAPVTFPAGAAPAPSAAPRTPIARAVLIAEVAPGITLTIDPGQVPRAGAVLARLVGRLAQTLQED